MKSVEYSKHTKKTVPEYLIVNNGVSQRSGFESQQALIFSGFIFVAGYSYVFNCDDLLCIFLFFNSVVQIYEIHISIISK